MIIALGVFDYYTGIEVPLSIFYLMPIALSAWYVNRSAGYVASLCSVLSYCLSQYIRADPISQSSVLCINCGARLVFFLLVAFIIYRLKHLLVTEVQFARTDPLTGIANRRYLYERSQLTIDQAKRSGRPISLAFLDLDDFKPLNDMWGHSHGDQILRMIGQEINNNIRNTDLAARLGGDEFGILLPETDRAAAAKVIGKLQGILLGLMTARGFPITFSFGIASFVSTPESVDLLINKADRLMYQAKEAGKNMIMAEDY
ncbi:MAG: GGDEF domain-containing protein [Candidatus Edwardsbacteria bacterium]|nr:GGDEF domain-containing protein [Candidatus Edwardsbacteria bacterium]MBU1577697.1 GGDEF domain-containing protein [Candidatus Edwardsbacteria bacterium]